MAKQTKYDVVMAKLDADILALEAIEKYLGVHKDKAAERVADDIERLQQTRKILIGAAAGAGDEKPKRTRRKKTNGAEPAATADARTTPF